MSKAALSEFLLKSAKYLDIHHGDTETTHPYVNCAATAAPIALKKNPAPAPVSVSRVFNMPPSYGDAVTRIYAAQREKAMRGQQPS